MTSEFESESSAAVPPQPSAAPLTAAEQAEARRYGVIELWCSLADKLLDIVALGAIALFLAIPLDRALAEHIARPTPRLAILFLVVTALHAVVSFPLSFFSGYVVERRFGLGRLSLAGWLGRYFKRLSLAALFGMLLLVGLYWIIWLVGWAWWIVAAGAFFLVSVVLGQLAPVVILPLFYKITRLDRPDLADRIARLAEGTGLAIDGVYRLDLSAETAKANAMLAGMGRTRRVLLGDTLLESFTADEIAVIFAHEIGHHVYRHIHKMIFAGVFFSAAGFWVCDRLVFGGAADYAHASPATLPWMMLVLTLFGLVMEPIQNIISRRYERQCDRYALRATGLKAAYRSAFSKLARINKDDPSPHSWEVFLFHSHPPISERLAFADE